MGIYDGAIVPVESKASDLAAEHGGSRASTAMVLNPVNLVTSTSDINWSERDYVPVAGKPVLSSVAEADRAEDEAQRYEVAVTNGARAMAATEDRLQNFAKLERAYCKMLSTAGKSAAEVLAARRALAGTLQEQRSILANLGFGLDRQIERTDTEIELIAESYGRA